MKVVLEPGKYVVAVSGGVDSMVLLDVLRQRPDLELVVAHFEHGIRGDSDLDRQLVESVAKQHNLPFIYEHGRLGQEASEAAARRARYDFLRRVKMQAGAGAILTAHHRDDALETAILNLLRGTGRRGLSALRSHDDVCRPLLDTTKQIILDYARQHGLTWREDSTNADDRYLRNYIRAHLVPRLGPGGVRQLTEIIENARSSNQQIDTLLVRLAGGTERLDRQWFIMLPHALSRELLLAWLRQRGLSEVDRPLVERLVTAAKVALPGKRIDIRHNAFLQIEKRSLRIKNGNPRQKG